MTIKVEGTDRLRQAADNIRRLFSPAALTRVAMDLAAEAGVQLKEAVVEKCIEYIYDLPEWTYIRTEALKRSHEVVDKGLEQIVRVNPDAPAEPEPRKNRMKVADYAEYVHDGYTHTGNYHPGRPWFEDAVEEHGPEIVEFVTAAFQLAVERALTQI